MPEHRQELVFRTVCRFGLGTRPPLGLDACGAFDRERHPLRGELEQAHVLVPELPWLRAPHVQHAEHATLPRHERDAREGADTLRADVPVDERPVIHLIKHDRPTLLRDPSGESRPDRHLRALADLFLQPHGRTGIQDAVLLQEDHGSRALQSGLHPPGQLLEKLLERQVGERGLGERLHPLRLGPRPLRDGEQLLAVPLRSFPLRDVTQDDGVERLSSGLALRDARFDRELVAVAPQPGENPLAAHHPHAHGRRAERNNVPAMDLTEPLREELVEGPACHLGSRVAEDRLGRSVEEGDPLVGVNRDDRIRRGRDDAAQPLL